MRPQRKAFAIAVRRKSDLAVVIFDAGARPIESGVFDYVQRHAENNQVSTLAPTIEASVPQPISLGTFPDEVDDEN